MDSLFVMAFQAHKCVCVYICILIGWCDIQAQKTCSCGRRQNHKGWGLAQGPLSAVKADGALQCSGECLVLQKSLHLWTPPGYATTPLQLFYLYDPKDVLTRVNPHGLKSVSSPKLSAISDHILQLPTSPAWQVVTGSISDCVILHIKEGDWLDYPVECQAQQQRTKGSGGHVIPLSCQPRFALHFYSPEYSLCC